MQRRMGAVETNIQKMQVLLETVRARCVLLKYDAVSEDALPPESVRVSFQRRPEADDWRTITIEEGKL